MTDKAPQPLGTERVRTDNIDEGVRRSLHQDTLFRSKFPSGLATPSVMDCNVWECGAGVIAITNFKNGQEGQTIRILGNVNNTINNNANIKTNTGANKVLAANKMYTFTMINKVWYEAE